MDGEDPTEDRDRPSTIPPTSLRENPRLVTKARGILGHLAHLILLWRKKLSYRDEKVYSENSRAKLRIQVSWNPGKPRGLVGGGRHTFLV